MAMWPGMVARRRNHPWADAVSIGGWVTFFLGFVLWPIVLIWAYVDAPVPTRVVASGTREATR